MELLAKVLYRASTISDFIGNLKSKKAHKIIDRRIEKTIQSNQDVIDYVNTHNNIETAKIFAVNALINNQEEKEKIRAKLYDKINNKVLKRASKIMNSYGGSSIDQTLVDKINKLYLTTDFFRYYNIAEKSQQLINYALWVSTNKNAILLSNISDSDKEFVNGVCKTLHLDLIYRNNGVADLENYDPFISGWNDQKYLVNLEAIRKLCTVNLMNKVTLKNNSILDANQLTIQTDLSKYSPIRWCNHTQSNTLVDPDLMVDNETTALLDSYIEPYLNGRDHWYTIGSDDTKFILLVRNPVNGIMEEYNLIVGYHGKNVVSLMIDHLGHPEIIHPNDKDLWVKELSNYFYQVTDQDINDSKMYQSMYFWIYNAIDMSTINESEIINNLDIILDRLFIAINNKGINLHNTRYRFEYYNGINDFILVSDDKVKNNVIGKFIDQSAIIVKNNEGCYRLNNIYETTVF